MTTHSGRALKIAADKYFQPSETTVGQLFTRVVSAIVDAGDKLDYFQTNLNRIGYSERLMKLLLEQKFSFNSPVYFNVGVQDAPQCWACLILSVGDHLDGESGIEDWWVTESETFRRGSGSGVNLSELRPDGAPLSGGKGVASGVPSFMRPADSIAGTITSGGRTRRAAKMVILNASHGDVEEFIETKVTAERMSTVLKDAGFDIGMNGKHSPYIPYQNANNSVRFTDEDMKERGDILRKAAEAAWETGDPGVQFDSTINSWHTCPESGRINASNPCSEYMFLDDTVCNLGSFNLMKYWREDGFDTDAFVSDIGIAVTAMDILVDLSSYPTKKVELTTKAHRTIGLGYANLGAALMSWGVPYDSDEGRDIAGAITALLTGAAYDQSAKLSLYRGPYPAWSDNKAHHNRIVQRHQSHIRMGVGSDERHSIAGRIWADAGNIWNGFATTSATVPFRNAQVTVLAPTGTIGLFMDCETLGVEPALAISAEKELVGGGSIDFGVRECVEAGIQAVDRAMPQGRGVERVVRSRSDLLENSPVFATALGFEGGNIISPEGHVKMMAAVQPFLSGAISKTVNLPSSATVEDVEGIYRMSHELGLKSIAVYRDGSKGYQPLTTTEKRPESHPVAAEGNLSASNDGVFVSNSSGVAVASRRKPGGTRDGWTHRFEISGSTFYLTVNEYSDGSPCEIFLRGSKHGSTINGLLEAFSIGVSIGLQYGVPISKFIEHYAGMNFAPQGVATADSDIKFADSLVDYTFRLIQDRYTGVQKALPINEAKWDKEYEFRTPPIRGGAGTFCPNCNRNGLMRSGSCFVCAYCGETTGCS